MICETTAAILINKHGQVLLEQYRNGWALPRGTIDVPEHPECGMLRSLREQMEKDTPIAYWKSFELKPKSADEATFFDNMPSTVEHVYVGGLNRPIESIKRLKGQTIGYFDRDEIRQMTLLSDYGSILEEFFGGVRVAITSAILLDRENRVLMQHRADDPNISAPNLWSLWGGRVDVNETPFIALQRELREEIGREARNVELWRTYELPYDDYIKTDQYVFVGVVDWPIEDITVYEGQGAAYLTAEEIAGLPVALNFGKIIKTYFSEMT